MNRVDLVVGAALQVVRPQRAAEVLEIVASLVVVLYAEITVTPQALGDHEVVWLVAAGHERGQPPCGPGVQHRGAGERQPWRARRSSHPVAHPGGRAHRRRAGGQNHRGDRRPHEPHHGTRPDQGHRWQPDREPRHEEQRAGEERFRAAWLEPDRPRERDSAGDEGAQPPNGRQQADAQRPRPRIAQRERTQRAPGGRARAGRGQRGCGRQAGGRHGPPCYHTAPCAPVPARPFWSLPPP